MNRFFLSEKDQLVIKTGTNVVMRKRPGREGCSDELVPDWNTMEQIAWEIGEIMDETSAHVTLVSSGAIAFARYKLKVPKPKGVPAQQAAAALAQQHLQNTWNGFFDSQQPSLLTSMHLLSPRDFAGVALENLQNTFGYLDSQIPEHIQRRVVRIVNENDTTTTSEITFGDNDQLAAQLAVAIGSKRLILLSDVDGVYTGDPGNGSGANLISQLHTDDLTDEFIARIAGDITSDNGTGGMKSKLIAARLAARRGAMVVIANGKTAGNLKKIVDGDLSVGTWVLPE